jgi:hypothetical protein
MKKQLVFYSMISWGEENNHSVYGVVPIRVVADHYETTPEMIQEVFEAWISEGMPTYYNYVIDFFYTLRRNEKRNIYLGLHYDPETFVCDGTIKTLVQWGDNPDNKRWSEKRTISFAFEPILSIDTHEKRSKE